MHLPQTKDMSLEGVYNHSYIHFLEPVESLEGRELILI